MASRWRVSDRWPSPGTTVNCAVGSARATASATGSGTLVSRSPCQRCTPTRTCSRGNPTACLECRVVLTAARLSYGFELDLPDQRARPAHLLAVPLLQHRSLVVGPPICQGLSVQACRPPSTTRWLILAPPRPYLRQLSAAQC